MPRARLVRAPRAGTFLDREEFTTPWSSELFAIMETGCRCGAGSPPGCGTAGDESSQTTQMTAMASAGRDTPETHVILARSPATLKQPRSPNQPRSLAVWLRGTPLQAHRNLVSHARDA